MSGQQENFYKILGVNENASGDDIKKAYRKLSLKYHPDKNNGNSDQFQKINNAYEVLSDLEKRQEYDSIQNNPFINEMHDMGDIFGGFDNPHQDINNLFGHLFGQKEFFQFPSGEHNFSSRPNIRIFKSGRGVMSQMNTDKPIPIIKNISISMEQVFNGANLPISIERWILENGQKIVEKETLYVKIPKGADDNEIIILKEKGNVIHDACRGDVKIIISIESNSNFKRDGLNLIYTTTLSLKEALCGFSFDLKYINGKIYKIHNSRGIIVHPFYKQIIKGMGFTRENDTGSMIIEFNVEFPKSLDPQIIEKLKELL
jgi:DnaJ-class molecular chaperone